MDGKGVEEGVEEGVDVRIVVGTTAVPSRENGERRDKRRKLEWRKKRPRTARQMGKSRDR